MYLFFIQIYKRKWKRYLEKKAADTKFERYPRDSEAGKFWLRLWNIDFFLTEKMQP